MTIVREQQDTPAQRGLRHTEYARASQTQNPAAGPAPQLHCRAMNSHRGTALLAEQHRAARTTASEVLG